ncbi:MAG: ABC transporter ATP-binding protein [Actinobacteria bacterium]|nr:ABC transporter ATP-binding protein [Actinomycetota bacterium]
MMVDGLTLEVERLSCDYGDRRALDAISVAFKKGLFTAIVGPNGSGKTTLLKALTRVITPLGGAIFLNGKDVVRFSRRELARLMAVVPQEASHAFAFTALEVVLMGRTPHLGRFEFESARDMEVARDAMERTNVWCFKDRPVTELSGGEKQRVIIAQALAQEPKALLLDEPTLHLDLSHQLDLMNLFKRLNYEGLTVVAVLHDLNLAAYYADVIALVKEGRLIDAGVVEETLTPLKIKEIFGADVLVDEHPATGRPHVTVLPLGVNGSGNGQSPGGAS